MQLELSILHMEIAQPVSNRVSIASSLRTKSGASPPISETASPAHFPLPDVGRSADGQSGWVGLLTGLKQSVL